jgi:uncharacterized protein HemX
MPRDTMNDFAEPTPPGSLKAEAKKRAGKLVVALMALLMALIGYWTVRITVATQSAKDAAENAQAKGEQSAATAKTVKVENQAGYTATAEKVDASGQVLVEMAAELKRMREELDQLKAAKAGRRIRRRAPPVTIPKVVNTELPKTPAAAAAAVPEAQP